MKKRIMRIMSRKKKSSMGVRSAESANTDAETKKEMTS